jgi:inosine-uridine nucleoside N-ribohydrolase
MLSAWIGMEAAGPIPVIFDTDMGNDIDDAMALGVIHSLQTRGVCELLAVTSTKDHPKSAAYIDAINTFYGRGDIPIGVVRDGATPKLGKYLELADVMDDGKLRFPNDLRDGSTAPEAVGLLRRILASRKDGSVVLTQVGFFTNFKRLLESKPDEHSPLPGIELIRRKVKLLSIMAGSFQTIRDNNHYKEYNVWNDIPSARKLAADWPTRIVWSGFEIGITATYPSESIVQDYNYVAHHPIKEGYYLYNPPPHDRPTWDLTAVLYALLPDRGYFDLSTPGQVTVEEDGFTRFTPKKGGRDRFLILDPLKNARLREALVQLSSQPPAQ